MTKPAQPKRQHPQTPIGRLLNRYAISLSKVADCLLVTEKVKFNSRSTLHRMVHGTLSDEMKATLHPPTARCLSKFLVARGLDKAEIDAELATAFTQGEYSPMIAQRIELRRDECEWFGLEKDPFTEFPTRKEDVFVSPPFQRVIDRVFDALRYPAFLAVTGEIGSGKDVLRAMIEDHVANHSNLNVVWPEFMNQAKINETHIARAFLRHFGYGAPGSSNKIPGRVEDLGNELKKCLAREYKAGNRITLAINECHHLNDKALSSLKNFFEMGSGGFQRWLSVLLIGQPSFATTSLENGKKTMRGRIFCEQFREIAERLILMEMPTPAEFHICAPDYLRFRLTRAGAPADLFDEDSISYIARQATTPQQLGNLANQALRHTKTFKEKKVLGDLISTKMIFERNNEPSFRQRKAS